MYASSVAMITGLNIEKEIPVPSRQHRKAASVQNFNSLKHFMLFNCPQLVYDAKKL